MTRSPWDLFIHGLTLVNSAVLAWVVFVGMAVHPSPGPGPVPNPQPNPPMPATTPLAASAKAYRDGLAQEFEDAAGQVKRRSIKGPSDLATFLGSHSTQLQSAIQASSKAHQSSDGSTFSDPDGMAADLQSAADALGAKK